MCYKSEEKKKGRVGEWHLGEGGRGVCEFAHLSSLINLQKMLVYSHYHKRVIS